MNILVVFFHFPPISGGGVIVAADIVNSLAESGHEITVLTPNLEWNGPKYQPDINSKINVIRVNVPSKNNLKVAARRCKSPLIKKGIEIGTSKKFDFVFTIFHPFHLVPKAAVEAAKELQIPSIVKVDDAIYEKSSGMKSIQRRIEKMINGKTLRNASNILVSNNNTLDVIIKEYNVAKEKISIVPNGVDLSKFNISKQKNPKKIVFAGAMYYHRGLDILLNAIPKIVKIIPDSKFLLIGSGDELEKLKVMVIKNNLENNVEFTGWINRDKIPENIADASIGIGPLRLTDVTSRALPIKVLEYMAVSLPVIAQKGTLPDDVLVNEKNGYFIDNENELASKIIFLLKNNETCTKMGQKSKEMVSKFDWSHIAEAIMKESENIASNS